MGDKQRKESRRSHHPPRRWVDPQIDKVLGESNAGIDSVDYGLRAIGGHGCCRYDVHDALDHLLNNSGQ